MLRSFAETPIYGARLTLATPLARQVYSGMLPGVIAGWQEAVPLMVEGEKTRFWIPAQMAYGDAPGRPNGMLVFDIELVRIEG